MSADFGYINARVKGLKSRLLTEDFYTQALGSSDFSAFLSSLAQSPYMQDLEEAQSRLSGLPAVDQALARNFYSTTRSILSFSDGNPHRLIALLLRQYDLANIKAIARAKHAGREAEDALAALLPAGELKPSVLEHLATTADLRSMAQALALTEHPLAPAFTAAVRQYVDDGDLYELELALDRAFAESLRDTVAQLPLPAGFKAYVALEIDATNLRTALKLRGREAEAADLFLPGGSSISSKQFAAIIADDEPETLGVLSGTPFAAVASAGSLSAADSIIRAVLDETAHRLALRNPLGPGVVLDYLRRKERETARLRLLARGKFYNVPRQQLERELGSGTA
jgi:V/A-type H+-transporting ATPase subunit C